MMSRSVPVFEEPNVPLPQFPQAATIRVYRFKAGEAPSAPQGGSNQGLTSREDLRHAAIKLWNAEIAVFEAKAVAPAWVLSNSLGPDLFTVTLQHPAAGVLRTTIITVEPV